MSFDICLGRRSSRWSPKEPSSKNVTFVDIETLESEYASFGVVSEETTCIFSSDEEYFVDCEENVFFQRIYK